MLVGVGPPVKLSIRVVGLSAAKTPLAGDPTGIVLDRPRLMVGRHAPTTDSSTATRR